MRRDIAIEQLAAAINSTSFQLKECCEHWRREIKQAMETGKTVLVFLTSLQEVYIDTGQRSYSGTGRNQKTTRIVALYNNYQAIPATLLPVSTTGSAMKLFGRGTESISAFWSEFETISQYQVLLTETNILLLLPDIDFYPKNFTKEKEGKQHWTPAANQFAARMVGTIVALDKTLRSSAEVTPEPAWATSANYSLGTENKLRQHLLEAEQQLEMAQRRKELVAEELLTAGSIRGLLFEKGKPLESAIIEALRTFSFKAAQFKDSTSEFDVVYESDEGRLIGEAEGKDSKAVNIDKLRQQ